MGGEPLGAEDVHGVPPPGPAVRAFCHGVAAKAKDPEGMTQQILKGAHTDVLGDVTMGPVR
ncbi:hypothetical protein [Kitasatospora sp. NPDC057223]|uniref:hypothetical protein n=1 Tax=Kitasatospora sp. NPDC057223 TaxID=3346055 RepID=UPI0036399569